MCDNRRTITEKILDEQKQTNELLRLLLSKPGSLKHHGSRVKIAQIQRILGVPDDGIIGPQTRRAFNYLEQ